MGKQTSHQTNFTAGEISPRLFGRTDIAKYNNGAQLIENFEILTHGGIKKRSGSVFIARAADQTMKPRVYPFQFNTEQSYILGFENNLIRIYADGGIVTEPATTITGITQANPGVVTTSASHGYSNGDKVILNTIEGMVELNNREFTVANVTATTFELTGEDTTSFTAYTTDGDAFKIVEVVSTYLTSELASMRFAQSADTLFIAHEKHRLARLTRSSNISWTLSDTVIEDGPFRDINGDDTQKFFIAIDSSTVNLSNATQADPVVITTSTAHGFESGECVTFTSVGGMTQLNGNRFFIIKLTSTTFSLRDESYRDIDGTGFGAYTSGGTVNRSVTKWGTFSEGSTNHALTTDFSFFTSAMVGQLIRLWEPGQATGLYTPVTGATISSSSVITNDGKVYGLSDLTGTTVWSASWNLPNHSSGVVHLNDSGASDEVDVVFLHDVSVVVKVTSVADSTTATCQVVKNHIPADVITYGTSVYEEGAWSDEHGFPRVVAFHEQRLWAGGSTDDPQTIWASRTGAFLNFQDGDEDDDSLNFQIASEKVDVIRWMSAGQTLAVGTVGSEYSVTANETGSGITPSNIRVMKQTSYGSTQFEPVRVGPVVIFPARFGKPENSARKLREYVYGFQNDAYQAEDITIISEHITGTGVTEMAYADEPNSIISAIREDGQIVNITYEREQDVVAFCRQIIGGQSDAGGTNAIVESIAVIPGAFGDTLYVAVQRFINGETVRYIEFFSKEFQQNDIREDGIFVDSSLTYTGVPTTTVTGLNHLIGETVRVLRDGVDDGSQVVTAGGSITIDLASKVHVGYSIVSKAQQLNMEVGANMGVAQSRIQRVSDVFLRLYQALGGRYGTSLTNTQPLIYRDNPDGAQELEPDLHTGFVKTSGQGGYDRDTSGVVVHDEPFPFTILTITSEVNTSG